MGQRIADHARLLHKCKKTAAARALKSSVNPLAFALGRCNLRPEILIDRPKDTEAEDEV
jgi:hypothetical protein